MDRLILRFPVIGIVAALALGLGVGVLLGDDSPSVRDAERARARAVQRSSVIAAERDRLRIERDSLEARLAAGKAPAVCPRPSISSGRLFRLFAIDYPCAWHVVTQVRTGQTAERPGLLVDLSLFSSVPISLAPQAGSLADIELAIWSDDPSDGEDQLESATAWVEDERARFADPRRESRFEGGSNVTVTALSGVLAGGEEPVRALVAIWGFIDGSGDRHVVRVVALNPSERARQAVDRIARSFNVFER